MLSVGCRDEELPIPRIVAGNRDEDSPGSVIFTHPESNFTVGSDFFDHDSLIAELSNQLGGCDLHHVDSCEQDQDRVGSPSRKKSNCYRKCRGKEQENRGEEEEEEERKEEDTIENKEKKSPPHVPKECQAMGSRSEDLVKKQQRRRPVSLDLNSRDNAVCSSPKFTSMKKSSIFSCQPSTFPSPGTPNYRQDNRGINRGGIGFQRGWSSERVPLQGNCGQRYGNAVVLPFNNGRSLPSKWEDAEKWIFSPGCGNGVGRPVMPPPHRRPKSKSGPLEELGIVCYSSTPVMPVFDGGKIGNFIGSSPFSAGVLVTDVLTGRGFKGGSCSIGSEGRGGGGGSGPVQKGPDIAKSVSSHGWSDSLIRSSLPKASQHLIHCTDKEDGSKDAATMISPAISRRDMATQMSPEHSSHSSAKDGHSLNRTSSAFPTGELHSHHPSKLEVKDVQVDDCVTVTKRSKKRGDRGVQHKGSTKTGEWKKKAVEAQSSAWEIVQTDKCISKSKREEARIMAWENLQKAKAEAEIRKLEMKLEKIRTSSMDKIMNKLRLAQRKAQDMRSSVSENQVHEVARTAAKAATFPKAGQMGSLTGCFTFHAF